MPSLRLMLWIVGFSVFWYSLATANTIRDAIRSVTITHPFCEERMELGVGQEVFDEVANDVEGTREYNRIVREYRKQNFPKVGDLIKNFNVQYESSPLREPAQFLALQVEFESAEGRNNVSTDLLMKRFRELALLFPKSYFLPGLRATVASFWLSRGEYSKALSIYEMGARQHSEHPLACSFLLGAGEAVYFLGKVDEATAQFNKVLQKCKNRRVRVGASIRLADLKREKDPKAASKSYEKVIGENVSFTEKYYPSAFHNVGELKFRQKKFDSAKYYFRQHLKSGSNNRTCASYSRKRIADIAAESGVPANKVAGMYLEIRERFPGSEVGEFCYLHALAMELASVPLSEYERRVKIIDEKIDSLRNRNFRELIYLEKGLASLVRGEKTSFDYLIRLDERSQFNLKKGVFADLIRKRLLDYLVDFVKKADAEKWVPRKGQDKEDYFLKFYEPAYKFWLEGTPDASKARKMLTRIVLDKFITHMGELHAKTAYELLVHGQGSVIWEPKAVSREIRFRSFKAILRALMATKEKAKFAKELSDKRSLLEPLLGSNWGVLTIAIAHEEPGVERSLATNAPQVRKNFTPVVKRLKKDQQDYLRWAFANREKNQGRLNSALTLFAQIKGKSYSREINLARVNIFEQQKKYAKAFDLLAKQNVPQKERPEVVAQLKEYVERGNLWRKISTLEKYAQVTELKKEDQADLAYFSGKLLYAAKKWKSSESRFEKYLGFEMANAETAESTYKLGKIFLRQGEAAKALTYWERVVQMNDPFWSPLARNEIVLNSK